MPINVVKTQRDEDLWNKAKDIAAKNGQQGNWPYVMGIYKKMTGYEKKASEIYLTASDYKEFFEKYAASAVKNLASKAIAKAKDIPGRFKTEYDLGHPETFGGKLKDIATFGGYRRGRDAFDYAKYSRTEMGGKSQITIDDLRKANIPEDTIKKLQTVRKNSYNTQNIYENAQKQRANFEKDFRYKHGVDYDKMMPDEVVETYNKIEKKKHDAEQLNRKENKRKEYKPLNYDQISNILNGEKNKARKQQIDTLEKDVAARKSAIDPYLAEIRRARDNELAKSLGFYAVPAAGLAYGGHSLYNRHKDE